jgi:hypothetical protein
MASVLKRIYWQVSAGFGIPGELLPDYLFFIQRYWLARGRLRLFLRPRTYNELLHRSMLRSRDPRMKASTEKVSAREYAASKIGRDYLVPLLHVGEDPEAIPFQDLPHQYVIKASHGSGFNVIVGDKSALVVSDVKAQLRQWLDIDWYLLVREWAYEGIPRRILIERLLLDRGQLPGNYRHFVFNGKVRLIASKQPSRLAPIIVNRPQQPITDYFDADWRPLIVRDNTPSSAFVPAAPKNLVDMIRLAEVLAEGFESCCIDLYNIDGKIFFGEVTHYCAGGLAGFTPDFDRALGEVWRNGGPIPERFYRTDAPSIDASGMSPRQASGMR